MGKKKPAKSGIRPKKHLGQNFLVERGAVGKFLSAASIQKDDSVLEVGPGTGILTLELAKLAKEVIAVEKDKQMYEILQKLIKTEKLANVKIVYGDIRLINTKNYIQNTKYKVVANIPYYLTAHLIKNFLEADRPPKDMTLVIQKEVAQRICAKPPDMNLLAVSVQFYSNPKIIAHISKGSFWPVPKVDSAIIKISNIKNQILKKERNEFFKIVRAGFSQPRKQLLNNLARGLNLDRETVKAWLKKNEIKPEQRAETLSLDDWLYLTQSAILASILSNHPMN